jgi:2-polyprenyl-3-methyl-5-hydroxy-6-metoxy-1,4-benzoquinol methylase
MRRKLDSMDAYGKWINRWLNGRDALRRIGQALLLPAWLLSGHWVARYYQRLLTQHGLSPQALAERTDQKDQAFYDHLFAGVDLRPTMTVLDIGCGMGDLIDYLHHRRGAILVYLGIDLVLAFIRACQQRYPPPYRFQHSNFVHPAFAPQERFGLVVNMGGMVSRVLGYEAYLAYCSEKMIHLATRYVLFNVITEVQSTLGNYMTTHQVGQITSIPKPRLVAILNRVTHGSPWNYTLRDVQIYPDAIDTFVCLRKLQR